MTAALVVEDLRVVGRRGRVALIHTPRGRGLRHGLQAGAERGGTANVTNVESF